jgi:type II secretory pathway pseudopilin PulG
MAEMYLLLNDAQQGPFSADQVRAMLAAGEITPETLAWQEGMSDWAAVASLLGPPPAPEPVLPPSPAPLPAPPPTPAAVTIVPATLPAALPPEKGMSPWLIALLVVAGLAVLALPCCCILSGVALGPITAGIKKAKENAALQQTRAIELAMMAYATDHNGAYPDGQTSTEVFQKLLDGNYVSDPALFCPFSMPGKVKAVGSKLTAENVGFDCTAGVTTNSPGYLPVVFSSGYDVNYANGGLITPSVGGYPSPYAGIAVAYRDGSARFLSYTPTVTTIQLLPAGTVLGGGMYRQLKP